MCFILASCGPGSFYHVTPDFSFSQNQLQSDVRRVCSHDKAPLLLTFSTLGRGAWGRGYCVKCTCAITECLTVTHPSLSKAGFIQDFEVGGGGLPWVEG